MLMLCEIYCCGDCAQIAPPPCSVGIDGGSAMQRRTHELVEVAIAASNLSCMDATWCSWL